MLRRKSDRSPSLAPPAPTERVTTVLGAETSWRGSVTGRGGMRIEGAFEGDINLHGLLVIGESGRVTCDHLQATTVIIAGAVKGNITAQKLEIRATGRVWGDVVTSSFATEEGAFLRGEVRMEERVELEPLEPSPESDPAITPQAPAESSDSGQ